MLEWYCQVFLLIVISRNQGAKKISRQIYLYLYLDGDIDDIDMDIDDIDIDDDSNIDIDDI